MSNDSYHKRILTRREALKTIGLSAASITLAACGGGDGNGATDGGAEGAVANPATPAPPLAAAGPTTAATPLPPTPVVAQFGKGSKQIQFWHGLGGADGATMVDMLKQYSQEKADVSVQAQTYPWDTFYQKLPTSVLARTPPEMAIMHEWAIPQFAQMGVLQRADQMFFDEGLIPKEDFNPEILKKVTVDGVAYGVPFDNHGWGMYYNTKLIKDAGLDPEKLPANGDEFIQWTTKLTTDEAGKHPDEDGFNASKVQVWGTHPTWLRPTLLSTLWQFEGGVWDPETKKATLASQASVNAVQYWHDLIYKHRVAPAPAGGAPGGGDLYENNKLALWWDGSWNLNYFVDRPKVQEVTKAAFLPSLAQGNQAAWMSAHVLVVPQGISGDKLQPTQDLIAWLSKNGSIWATSGQVPARLSVQNSGEIGKMWSVNMYAEEFQKIGQMEPSHPAITEIQAAYQPAFDAALNNVTPVKEALQQADQKIQSILDRP